MAANTIPPAGLSLVGLDDAAVSSKHPSKTAILLQMSQTLLSDLKRASASPGGLQFVTGSKVPKLRIGNRSIDLHLSPDRFRTELYHPTSSNELAFSAHVSHRADTLHNASNANQTPANDEALAALKSSMAHYAQEKKATQTQVTDGLLPIPKNRWDAARQQKRGLMGNRGHAQASSPSLGPARSPSLSPTAANFAKQTPLRAQAIRVPVLHLLATKPMLASEIAKETHIPSKELDEVLQGVGQQADGKWRLSDKAHKDLDVWHFKYGSQEDRQSAIDNAIKAYDRLRVSKDDKLWQLLLAPKERGKGKVLSRLHLGAGQSLTPSHNASPNLNASTPAEVKNNSSSNTPRVGPSGTPTLGATKSSGGDIMKRLLSKDPKKARAAKEAMEKKREKRQAVDADQDPRPAKRQATASTKKSSPATKSAEFVYSSDDEVEAGVTKGNKGGNSNAKGTPRVTASTSQAPAKSHAVGQASSKPSNASKPANQSSPAIKAQGTPAVGSPALKTAKAVTGSKTTPQVNKTSKSSPQQRPALSPSKSHTRPTVPSPLGAARARVASDVSDRSGIGLQRKNNSNEAPKGLGISTAPRKRHDTVTCTDSLDTGGEGKSAREKVAQILKKPVANGTSTPRDKPATPQQAAVTKRKLQDNHDQNPHANKQRKVTSSASQHLPLNSSISTTTNSTTRTTPDERFDGASSDSSASIIDTITFAQGVTLAQKFRDHYYPQYLIMYDTISNKESQGESVSSNERDKLWEMHGRLQQMKRELEAASRREQRGSES